MNFRDLQKQYEVLKPSIDSAITDVLTIAKYINGPQVKELEQKLAEYVGVKHCITCANGTDALTLALKAWGVGTNDVVFVPDFTFFSSGECPAIVGATPVFVDVDSRTYNLDAQRLDLGKKESIIIDLASNPGGVERKAAREKGLKVIWALSLPAKVAPLTSAEFIKETLYHVLKEL